MSPGNDSTIVSLSPQEVLRLEMILTDRNKDEALAFLSEMYQKIKSTTIRGMKSHLDG